MYDKVKFNPSSTAKKTYPNLSKNKPIGEIQETGAASVRE